jgi:hypothetical protein
LKELGTGLGKLLAIYIAALSLCTFVPARVKSVPFISLAQSIQFDIDPDSPVMSVEKDFLEMENTSSLKPQTTHLASLNNVVGKPFVPRQVASVELRPQVVQKTLRPMIDYSSPVRADGFGELSLSGPVELKQGLALTNEHTIEIHREAKGAIVEYGEVDVQKGIYNIKLSNLEGHICARLRSSLYEVIGEGCFSLDRVKNLNRSTTTQGPMISIAKYRDALAYSDKPVESAPRIDVASLEDAYKKTPAEKLAENNFTEKSEAPKLTREMSHKFVAQPKITDFYDLDNPEAKSLSVNATTSSGNLEDSTSTAITYITSPNHPTAIVVANSYTPSRGAVLPNNKALNALDGLTKDATIAMADAPAGKAWGRVLREGRSVAGAEVQIEGHDNLKPVYLNEFYIPDPNQKSTASHGLYTFVGVPEGEYSVRATQNNKFMGYQNISVRENALSLADIDSTERKRDVRLTVYDLVNKTSQGAVVTLQNAEEDVVVENGQADVQVQDNYDTAYAMVTPLDKRYMSAQYILNPGEDLYNFPLVESAWVEYVLSQAKLVRPVKNKIVLGIGAQKPFQVEAVGSRSAQVVYFDSNGQVIDGNFGQAGGGFLILDPEDDVNEYAIQSAGENTVHSVYMPTMPNVLNVIQL